MKFKAKKRVILSDFEPFLTLKFAKKMFSRAILPCRAVANAAKYFVSKLDNVEKVYEFTLPDDMPHVCRGCYACLNGKEEKCGGYEYLKPINAAFSDSEVIIFCCPVWCFHAPGQIKSFLNHYGYRWLVHRPNFDMINKQAVIITTAGGGGMKSAAKDMILVENVDDSNLMTKLFYAIYDELPESKKKRNLK